MSVQGGTLEGRRPSGQLQTSVCWPGGIACAEWHTTVLTFNLDSRGMVGASPKASSLKLRFGVPFASVLVESLQTR